MYLPTPPALAVVFMATSGTVCGELTEYVPSCPVPVMMPVMVVPAATPRPVMVMPAESAPEDTVVTVSVVDWMVPRKFVDVMNEPAVTPAPASVCPSARVPDVTLLTKSVVPEMLPCTMALTEEKAVPAAAVAEAATAYVPTPPVPATELTVTRAPVSPHFTGELTVKTVAVRPVMTADDVRFGETRVIPTAKGRADDDVVDVHVIVTDALGPEKQLATVEIVRAIMGTDVTACACAVLSVHVEPAPETM